MQKIENNIDFNFWRNFSSIIKSGSYNFLYNLILALSSFIFWIFVADKFSQENYGQARTIFAIISIISALLQFGLPTYNQLIFSQNNKNDEEYDRIASFKILLVFIYLTASIAYFFIDTRQYYITYIITIIVILLLDDIVRFSVGIYYGKNDFSLVFNSGLISRSVLIILSLLVFFYNLGLSFYLIVLLSANLIQALTLALNKNYRKIILHIPKFKLSGIRNLVIVISPLGLNNIFNLLYDKIDLPLISYYIDFNNVAQYSIAYSVYSLSGIVFGILLIPAFNYFTNSNSNDNMIKLLNKSVILIVVGSLFIIISFLLLGKPLIILVLGSKYLLAAEILPYFSLSIIFWGLNSLLGVYLNAQKYFKVTMYATLLGLITNLIIDILTLSRIGIQGAVLATTATSFVVFLTEYVYFLKLKKKVNGNSILG